MFTQQNHAAGTLALSDFVLTVRSWPLVNCDQGSLLCPLSLWWSGHSKSHSTTGSLASISVGFSWAKPQIGTFWWELCIPPWLFLVARVGRNSVFCRRLLAVRQLALAASLIEPQGRGTLSATQGTMLVCYLESQSFKLPPNSLLFFFSSASYTLKLAIGVTTNSLFYWTHISQLHFPWEKKKIILSILTLQK